MRHYHRGDCILYRMPKHSIHPGPRAEDVTPDRYGDGYTYQVEKYWTVSAVHEDGTVEMVTRTGKIHRTRPDDPLLRKAGLLKRVLYRSRFPRLG